jgi:CcmD family protein
VSNKFLFLAYSFVWLIFIVYVWNLSHRHARFRKDLEDLKTRLQVSSIRSLDS